MGKQWKTALRQEQAGKKGVLFTRLAREIQVAARLGGGDPEGNPRLQAALSAARLHSVPKTTVERALSKGCGTSQDSHTLEELLYEGFGPHKVAFVMKILTDSRPRTASQMRYLFKSQGGHLAESGSVLWMFEEVACIEAGKAGDLSFESVLEQALQVGAEDVLPSPSSRGVYLFYGRKEDLKKLHSALLQKKWNILKGERAYRAKNPVSLTEREATVQLQSFVSRLKDHPDISSLYTNWKEFEAFSL